MPSNQRRLAVAASAGFLFIGMAMSVVGPTLPALRDDYDLSRTMSSLLVSAFWIGSVLGVITGGYALPRLAPRHLIGAGLTVLAVGALGVAAAPGAVLVGLALLGLGAGFGLLDISINLTVARGFGDRSAAVLSATNACFGIGAIIGPLLVGRSPTEIAPPFLLCAAGAVLLLPLVLLLQSPRPEPVETPPLTRHTAVIVAGFALLLLGYVGAEAGTSNSQTTHLLDTTGLSAAAAANAASLFWVGLTLGRFAGAPVLIRIPPGTVAIGALAASAATLGLTTIGPVAVLGYALTGFFLGPVWPALVAWYGTVVPGGQGATAIFAAGLMGPVLFSPVLGASADTFGSETIPFLLIAAAGLTAGGAALFARRLRRDPLVPALGGLPPLRKAG